MTKSQKKELFAVTENNTDEYELRKSAEEFIELGLALLQQVNKPMKDLSKEITDEIGDAKLRLKKLELKYDKKAINRRIKYKLKRWRQYRDSHAFDNI